jgi:soluble lytic murein transglycosylase-like protein
MRRLITRGRLRACGVALTGIALMGLIGLTALQPVSQNGRPRVDSFALARELESVSTALASSSTSLANAASASSAASSSDGASTPAAPAASTFMATAAVPTPLPVLIVRIPPTAPPTPTPTPVVRAAAPAPASTGTSSSGGDIEAIITAAGQAAGVDPNWLISTAECESGLNPNAYNGAGPYEGLFQYLPSTFAAHGGTDIWDPTQQAQIAATMFANGESGEWPVCSR